MPKQSLRSGAGHVRKMVGEDGTTGKGFTRSVQYKTHGDDKVCPICDSVKEKVFPGNLHPKIPLHKNCRCKYESVNIESHFVDGKILLGDEQSIVQEIAWPFLKGIAFSYQPDPESGKEVVMIVYNDLRYKDPEQGLRLRTKSAIKQTMQRAKNNLSTSEEELMGSTGFDKRVMLAHTGSSAMRQVVQQEDFEDKESFLEMRRFGAVKEVQAIMEHMDRMYTKVIDKAEDKVKELLDSWFGVG